MDQYDEATYLGWAVPLKEVWKQIQLGSLYSEWLQLWGLWMNDRLEIYKANAFLLTVVMAPLFYLFLRRFNFSKAQSFLGFLILLFYPPLVLVTRTVNNFCVAVALGIFAAIMLLENLRARWFCLAAACFLLSYIRPEMVLAFQVSSVAYLGLIVRDYHREKKDAWRPVLGLFVLLALFFIQQLALNSQPKDWPNKSLYVFQDANERRVRELGILDWNFDQAYVHSSTVGQAVLNNPREFFSHVTYQSGKTISEIGNAIASFRMHQHGCAAGILALFVCFYAWSCRHRDFEFQKNQLFGLLILSLLSVPVLVVGMTLSIQTRYLLPIVVWMIAVLVFCLPREKTFPSFWMACLMLLVQILSPISMDLSNPQYLYYGPDANSSRNCFGSTEHFALLRQIQNLSGQNPIRVLQGFGATLLLNLVGEEKFVDRADCYNWQRCLSRYTDAEISAPSFRAADHFDVIIKEPGMDNVIQQSLISPLKIQFLKSLFDQPGKYGFKQLSLQCSSPAVFVTRALLDKAFPDPR